MKALQGVFALTSVWANEWQYKDILTEFDDLVCKDLSEDWHKYLSEKDVRPVKTPLCPEKCNNLYETRECSDWKSSAFWSSSDTTRERSE